MHFEKFEKQFKLYSKVCGVDHECLRFGKRLNVA